MTAHVKVSGTWRDVSEAHARVGGVWKKCEVWTRVGGIWKQIIATLSATLTAPGLGYYQAQDLSSPYSAQITFRLSNDGDVYTRASLSGVGSFVAQYTWRGAGASADYDARVTVNSGSLSGGTAGTWLNLASNRDWAVLRTTAGTSICNITVEIRPAGGGASLASATIDLRAKCGF